MSKLTKAEALGEIERLIERSTEVDISFGTRVFDRGNYIEHVPNGVYTITIHTEESNEQPD